MWSAAIVTILMSQEVIQTSHGPVRGERSGEAWAYRGIPFAAPPVDELRWQSPQPPAPWTEVRDARAFPPPCPQTERGEVMGSEDCLYLNVWSPADARPEPRPVMVFIHGGGNMQGSTSEGREGRSIYDGARLSARGGVVVVTIQYRLGALGFLVHPAIETKGNFGLRDQVLALEWVRDNIQRFGGDASRVLLFGESAGAVNTCLQMVSPLAAGLFHGALMQSGGCVAEPLATAQRLGTELAAKLECPDAACLRRVPFEKLVTAAGGEAGVENGIVTRPYGPVVDGDVIPDVPFRLLTEGKYHRVPFVNGANADETSSLGIPLQVTAAQYTAYVRQTFGPLADRVLAEYPLTAFPNPRAAMVAVTSDPQFICPSRRTVRAVSGHQSDVFRYFFTHTQPPPLSARGAFHGLELAYLFQWIGDLPNARPADVAVERAMLDYWTSFAATGRPASSVQWPAYDAARDTTLELATPVSILEGVRSRRCDFWDSLAIIQR